jgi:FixJ family two-component response regulator
MAKRPLLQQSESGPGTSVVVVIDDDASMRRVLAKLLNSVGLQVEAFESAAAFLDSSHQGAASCLILDIRLPGLSGLDLQAELAREDIRVPIIFITGHADVPMSVKAMKAGATDFLTKPFRDQDLLDAVNAALEADRKRRAQEEKSSSVLSRFLALKPREQEVMRHVAAGLMNKQIAYEMGLSEITVKIHRGNVMRKMEARSLADLVRMSDLLGGAPPQHGRSER